MISFGNVPIGSVLPIPFAAYAGSTGASITLTGLAVTDIEVYKGTSMTQRASDAGYVLMDTDGIDIDGITGIHGFSIDTGDNTDASFYAAGSFYSVVVSAVTVDSQTVNFIAATFRCTPAESSAGVPKVDVSHVGGTSQTAGDIIGDTNDIQARLPAALVSGRMDSSVGAMAANVITAAATATDYLAEINAEADTAIADAALATAANLATVAGYIDTEVAAIKAKTDNLPADPADASDIASAFSTVNGTLATIAGYVDTEVAAIKAKTDLIPASPAAVGDIPTAAAISDAVWDETLSGHAGVGSTGAALAAAGGSGDPWATALPGAYGAGTAGQIVGEFLDAAISDLPTALENADELLNRDMSAVSDTNARSPLNALRFIRNKFSISGTTLTVTKENDSTTAWTAVVSTDGSAQPIVGSDPA